LAGGHDYWLEVSGSCALWSPACATGKTILTNRSSNITSNYGVLPSGIAASLDAPATACKAWCNWMGKSFPRFSARRRMPLQAVALKKNRGGTLPVSNMSDNEHATAALWNSKVLSVKNSVGEPIPEFCQPSK